jgi:hypothetical protein
MRNLKLWFIELSRIGKVSVISTLALVGLFFASATAPPAVTPVVESQSAASVPAQRSKVPVVSTKTETEVISVPYNKSTRMDNSLAKGESLIDVAGSSGEKTITHTITLTDQVETGRTSAESITKLPTDEVTAIGTYVAPKYVAPAPAPKQSTQSTSSYYKNCTAARAAGAAPVYAGQPGYGKHLDRDGDGVGCE